MTTGFSTQTELKTRTEGTALAIAALQSFYLRAVFPSSTNNSCVCVKSACTMYGLTTPNEIPT